MKRVLYAYTCYSEPVWFSRERVYLINNKQKQTVTGYLEVLEALGSYWGSDMEKYTFLLELRFFSKPRKLDLMQMRKSFPIYEDEDLKRIFLWSKKNKKRWWQFWKTKQ